MTNVRDYARVESNLGIGATYFVQTKYVKDYNDDVFFTTNLPAASDNCQNDNDCDDGLLFTTDTCGPTGMCMNASNGVLGN